MTKDVPGITRTVSGFYKTPDEDGESFLAVEYFETDKFNIFTRII